MPNVIYPVGHSTHRIEWFIHLLKTHAITALADVRSTPYSRFNPQYNKESLKKSLLDNDIQYVFLGEELGARSNDPNVYENGRVSYQKLASTHLFQSGLDRLQEGLSTYTIALMCAEKEPLDCHRTILVASELERRGLAVTHILEDGSSELNTHAAGRLSKQLQLPEPDLFRNQADLVDEAYEAQARKIAYVRKPPG